MGKTRSKTRSQKHNDASNRERFKTFGRWSDLNHDVLFLVMMQLGAVDFVGFSGVCKSWRCFAHSNRDRFMASRPPLMMRINYRLDTEYILEDFERRRFKTLLPRAAGMCCAGVTCGYVVLFDLRTRIDLWLVNPITRHELHFPLYPIPLGCNKNSVRAVLVFSPSGWVLVMARRLSDSIWFSVAGTGAWNHVSSTYPIHDLHAFKGKIYTLHNRRRLSQMTLNPDPKLTLLEIKNSRKKSSFSTEFVTAGEKLYVIDCTPEYLYRIQGLDFGKMSWVALEEEYAFFLSSVKSGAAIDGATLKLESPRWSFYEVHDCFTDTAQKSRKARLFTTGVVWYFPHECMNVDYIDG